MDVGLATYWLVPAAFQVRAMASAMEESTLTLPMVVERLTTLYGSPPTDRGSDPFEMILAENVAYLANDSRREAAMACLRETVGTTPSAILAAPPAALAAPGKLGILPKESSKKLRRAAEVAMRECDGDVASILDLPVDHAKRVLRKFPGIGEPGAEKILLMCRRHAYLAPDSNALRVMVRLGICVEGPSYGATYAAARRAAEQHLPRDCETLISARFVLRAHGQRTCRNKRPSCDECLLASDCVFAQAARSAEGEAS